MFYTSTSVKESAVAVRRTEIEEGSNVNIIETVLISCKVCWFGLSRTCVLATKCPRVSWSGSKNRRSTNQRRNVAIRLGHKQRWHSTARRTRFLFVVSLISFRWCIDAAHKSHLALQSPPYNFTEVLRRKTTYYRIVCSHNQQLHNALALHNLYLNLIPVRRGEYEMRS